MLIIIMLISMLITGAGHGVLPARGPGRLRADTEVGVQERGRPQPAPHRVPRNRGRGRGRAARAAQMGRSSRLETQMKCFESRFYPRSNFQWANSINYKLRLRPSDPECRVLVAEDRGRQQEPLGLPQLVGAALLPRQVAPVPGDQDLGARVWPGPGVSRHLPNSCTLPIHYASGCPILLSLHIRIMKPVHFIPSPDRSEI